jgi:hypothetical protein
MNDLIKFFVEKFKLAEEEVSGKVPINTLTIVEFNDGSCHSFYPKDNVTCEGLLGELIESIPSLRITLRSKRSSSCHYC